MTDHYACQGHECLVNIGAALPADPQAAELVQPAESAFHHPACRAQAAAMRGAATRQNRCDAAGAQGMPVPSGIVSPIALHTIGPEARWSDMARHGRNGLHQHQQLCHIVAVGPGENRRQRNTVRVGDEMMLRSRLPAIRGIGARLRPPKTARTEAESTTAREKSILLASRSRASKAWWTVSQTPAFCQSRNRRQQVIPDPHPISRGRSSQGMPVFNTKRIPVNTARSSSRFRPGYRNRRRFGRGSNGAISAHNLSSNITLAMEVPPFHGDKISNTKHAEHSFC